MNDDPPAAAAAGLAAEDRALVEAARVAADRAYAPYSGFRVGAAARTADGAIHPGANMENASYGLSLCAEVQALMAASFAGGGAVVALAVTGFPADGPADGDGPVTPCGRCRQLLAEAAVRGGGDVRVLCASPDLSTVHVRTARSLLPEAFGPEAFRG